MKRTEMERIEREVRRSQKRSEVIQRKSDRANNGIASYIERLFSLFRYDENEIFNTQEDIAILELLEQIQLDVPEKKWHDVLRKAIKKAGVKQRDKAYNELCSFLPSPN